MSLDPSSEISNKTKALEWGAQGLLATLAIASLIMAGFEDREAIGTAMVGAAIAFGLSAAFFDRVIEVSTKGVKLADLRALEEAAERAAPTASPEEKEELIAESSEILASKRLGGEAVTPELAMKEAHLSWQWNGLAVEIRFANWLVERSWKIIQQVRSDLAGQPDLIAEKSQRALVIEIKTSRRPLSVPVVLQMLSLAAAVKAGGPIGPGIDQVVPVLVLGGTRLTRSATELASREGISVYCVDASNQITHMVGPELD